MCFLQGSIYESLVKKKDCQSYSTFKVFTKLSEIDPCEKRTDMLYGQVWQHIFLACCKLEEMAIYVVKQACERIIYWHVCTVFLKFYYNYRM